MTKIRTARTVMPLRGLPVSTTAIRAEIAEIRYQEKIGLISKEEADMKVQMLEAKIDEIENSPVMETQPQQVESTPDDSLPEFNEDSQNESDDDTLSSDDYFSQQAQNNRAFHNI